MSITVLNPERSVTDLAGHPPRLTTTGVLWITIMSGLGFGPVPRTHLRAVLALVAEQRRRLLRWDPGTRTNGEAYEETKGGALAVRALRIGARRADRAVRRVDRRLRKIADRRADLERSETEWLRLHGRTLRLGDAMARVQALQDRCAQETDAGSMRHHRVSRALRMWAWLVILFDLGPLLSYLAAVLNADASRPLETPLASLMTVSFAVLGTAGVATSLRWLGRSLRAHKDARGHLRLPPGQARTLPIAELGLVVAVLGACAWLLAYRILSDAGEAGVGGLVGVVLATFFAVVSVVVNWVIVAVEFRDGSVDTAEADELTAAIHRVRCRRQRIERAIRSLTLRGLAICASGERRIQHAYAAAGAAAGRAQQRILLARSLHGGTGPLAPDFRLTPLPLTEVAGFLEPMIAVDDRPLRVAAEHLRAARAALEELPH